MNKYDTKVLNLDELLTRPPVIDVESIRELAFTAIAVFTDWRHTPEGVIVGGKQYKLVEVD